MKIFICLKLIIDPDIVKFDVMTEKFKDIHYVMNEIDYQVLEQGLRLKEKYDGEVIAVSVAPEIGGHVLKESLLNGADRAIRVWNDQLQIADTWQTAAALGHLFEKEEFDFILCGWKSRDTGTQFMASALAHHLNISFSTGIVSIRETSTGELVVDKKLDYGKRETYQFETPIVLGLQEGINDPRYVALYSKTYRKGMDKKVEHIDIQNIPVDPLISTLRLMPVRPRVKKGIDITSLSMADRLKMMRGELGSKKDIFEDVPEKSARRILDELETSLK